MDIQPELRRQAGGGSYTRLEPESVGSYYHRVTSFRHDIVTNVSLFPFFLYYRRLEWLYSPQVIVVLRQVVFVVTSFRHGIRKKVNFFPFYLYYRRLQRLYSLQGIVG